MKLTPLILGLALLAMVSAAHAAEEDRWNVTTNPLLLLLGPNVQVDYRIDEHWTVGPQLFFIEREIGDYDLRIFSAGVNTNYYFSRAFAHSWFAHAGLGYSSAHVEYENIDGDKLVSNGNGLYLEGIGGYHWFWGDFNLRLGAGLTFNTGRAELRDSSGDKVKDGPISPVSLAADASLGWTF